MRYELLRLMLIVEWALFELHLAIRARSTNDEVRVRVRAKQIRIDAPQQR